MFKTSSCITFRNFQFNSIGLAEAAHPKRIFCEPQQQQQQRTERLLAAAAAAAWFSCYLVSSNPFFFKDAKTLSEKRLLFLGISSLAYHHMHHQKAFHMLKSCSSKKGALLIRGPFVAAAVCRRSTSCFFPLLLRLPHSHLGCTYTWCRLSSLS